VGCLYIDIEDFTAHKTAAQVIYHLHLCTSGARSNSSMEIMPFNELVNGNPNHEQKKRKNDIFTSI
jgi:hypothetical protein